MLLIDVKYVRHTAINWKIILRLKQDDKTQKGLWLCWWEVNLISDRLNNIWIGFPDPENPLNVISFIILALLVFSAIYILPGWRACWILPKWRPHRAPVLAPVKNVKSMSWATSGPNLVLLEESEPNKTFHVLPPPTNTSWLLNNRWVVRSPLVISYSYNCIKFHIGSSVPNNILKLPCFTCSWYGDIYLNNK